MSEKPAATTTIDTAMRRFREYVTAGIAALVIAGTIAMMVIALLNVQTQEDQFARIKDLLLLINPLIGVIIGYYFNKASTEARAESAEQAAQTATVSAQQAIEARNTAEANAQSAQSEAKEAKEALSEVSQAAEKALAESEPMAKTLRGGEGVAPAGDAYLELRAALARAKRITG